MSDQYAALRSIPLRDVLSMAGYSGWKQRRGKLEWTMKCPFHQPKKNNTSFSFTNEKFNCFSCGEHGSGAIDLAMKLKKLGFQEAVSLLGETNPRNDETNNVQRKNRIQQEETGERILENKPYNGVYEKHYVHSEWLKNRGLTEETLKLFGVGQYFNPSRKSLYSNKILFPILRFQDGVKTGYLARTIEENSTDPKYVFPKNFHKHLELFGAWQIKALGQALPLRVGFVVESPLCVMKYWQMGLYAVSPWGAFVSPEQVEIIQQLFRGVIFLPDRDKYPNVANTLYTLTQNLWVKSPQLPQGIDDPEKLEKEQVLALLRS